MSDRRIKLTDGKRLTYENGYVKPAGKYWKRVANKKVRKDSKVSNKTSTYKSIFGWFNWN